MVRGRKRSRGKADLQPERGSPAIRQLYAVFIRPVASAAGDRYRAVLS
jgi:hypothetical protein